MEDLVLAESRLENINAVEPILGALRTVSHGTWQKARLKTAAVQNYRRRILEMTASLLYSLSDTDEIDLPGAAPGADVLILAIGSERGLCGQFNPGLLNHLQRLMGRRREKGQQIHLWGVGSRFVRQLTREKLRLEETETFSTGALPGFGMARDLAQKLIRAYESGDVDEVLVVYTPTTRTGHLRPKTVRLIPPSLDELETGEEGEGRNRFAPPPIIEADPYEMLGRLIEHGIVVQLYEYLMASTSAENATRFFLMEEATQNVDRLLDELKLLVQIDRQQRITQEMGELAVGSGLLKTE